MRTTLEQCQAEDWMACKVLFNGTVWYMRRNGETGYTKLVVDSPWFRLKKWWYDRST